MRGASLLAVVGLVLAGCAGPDESPAVTGVVDSLDPSPAGPMFNFTSGIPVPVWNVGDWWQYHIEFASGEKYDAKLVVYKVESGNYLLTSDDRDLVLRAAFNHYPNIGPVRAASLNQFIHGAEVSYLKFPMKNGTWSATYRDFQMNYEASFAMLDAGTEKVPGFLTTMTHAVDGKLRMGHAWSPVTKWFTHFTWDFDGAGAPDVTARLTSWGSNHTGTLPVVNLIEIVHRPFPTTSAPPNPQGPPPNPSQSTVQFKIGAAGSTFNLGYFAGAGGQGAFDVSVAQQGGTTPPARYEWRPTSAGSTFAWHRIQNPAVGDWHLTANGAAQNSAFLFVEAYEARTTEVTI